MKARFFLLLALIASTTALTSRVWAVDLRTVKTDAGLVVLVTEHPEGSLVDWEAFTPDDLKFETFELKNGKSVVVFCLFDDVQRVVITSDMIDWENRLRSKVKWIVEPNEPPPPPNPAPPGPSPGPSPGPNGFDKAIADAVKLIDKDSCKSVADCYASVAEQANMHRDVYSPALMVDEVKSAVATKLTPKLLSLWRPVFSILRSEISKLNIEDSDTDGYIDVFRAFAKVLGG